MLALVASSRPLVRFLGRSRSPLCRGPWPQSAAPLQVARPWPVALTGGLAVASHHYRWPSHGRLPPVLAAFAMERMKEVKRPPL
ncbi:hypothetical protein GW17_00033820 [Ensete ventricosum]|nr:hypothetical protein GW17_00033820 [Ensete ventricosum]